MIASQAAGSGIQECAEASSGVSIGNSLVSETQRGSISPTASRSPADWKCISGDPSVERDTDLPARGVVGSVVPDEGWRGNFRRENRTVLGVINRNRGQARRLTVRSVSRLRKGTQAGQRRTREDCSHDEQGDSASGSVERVLKVPTLFVTHWVSNSRATQLR